MNKYTEIHPNGQRAYQFVADTAYVRESGTKGEHKAAEYILKEAEQVKKAGDFHTLYDSCCGSGRSVRRLEKAGQAVEEKGRAGNLPAL